MGEYKPADLRNITLLGHGSSGKTSLSEAMLFAAGAVSRLGRIEDKNTVSDYDEEEHRRGLSVSASVLSFEWQKKKLNVVDAPGYTDFVGEVKNALRAVDAGVLVICAASGVEVGAELHWQYLKDEGLPSFIFVNKMDRDNANFEQALEQLSQKFDGKFVPVQIPVGAQAELKGVVDLVTMKAYMGPDAAEQDIPADIAADVQVARMQMVELAVEIDDELMMKYLEEEEITDDEIVSALSRGARSGDLTLVFAGSATERIGVKSFLNAMIRFAPSPVDVVRKATDVASGEEVELTCDINGPLVAQVFKTLADPFVGKMSFFRVFSGSLTSDSRVYNVNQQAEQRVGQVFIPFGKDQKIAERIVAGDIGVVNKLDVTVTSDTLCDRGEQYQVAPIAYPQPLFSVAVFPKSKADLDKMGQGLARLTEEDNTLRVERNSETNELIISGMGDSHIQIAARKLASKFGVEIETELPKIAYRETITQIGQVQGRHKKQTGGRGQFGDCWIRFEPLERGAGFEFANEIFGGSVPKQYVPAVEKGLNEVLSDGVIAGYPTVDLKAIIYDGSYHPVDSSEMAFKLAAHLAFKNGIPLCAPVLLEPVMNVVVTVPEESMGDILGDLNTRRARVSGMESARGNGIVTAQVPLAEIQRYATDLRSMTQGRGYFSMEFSHYDIVPSHLIEQIQADAKERAERE